MRGPKYPGLPETTNHVVVCGKRGSSAPQPRAISLKLPRFSRADVALTGQKTPLVPPTAPAPAGPLRRGRWASFQLAAQTSVLRPANDCRHAPRSPRCQVHRQAQPSDFCCMCGGQCVGALSQIDLCSALGVVMQSGRRQRRSATRRRASGHRAHAPCPVTGIGIVLGLKHNC